MNPVSDLEYIFLLKITSQNLVTIFMQMVTLITSRSSCRPMPTHSPTADWTFQLSDQIWPIFKVVLLKNIIIRGLRLAYSWQMWKSIFCLEIYLYRLKLSWRKFVQKLANLATLSSHLVTLCFRVSASFAPALKTLDIYDWKAPNNPNNNKLAGD